MRIDHLTGRWKVCILFAVMFYKRNMSHMHSCMYCVVCRIFTSKCDYLKHNSYQRETVLKINRYSFTFRKMSLEQCSLSYIYVGARTFLSCLSIDHTLGRIIWIACNKIQFYWWKKVIGNMCEIKKKVNKANKKGNPVKLKRK